MHKNWFAYGIVLTIAVLFHSTILAGTSDAAPNGYRASAGCPTLAELPANISAVDLRCRCYDQCSGSDPTPPAARPPAVPQSTTPAPVSRPPVASVQTYTFIIGLNASGDNFLSLRARPNGRELKRMGPDMLLTELGREGSWVNVQLRTGETGWAYSRYLACCKPAPTTAGTGRFHYLVGLHVNGDNWLALRSEPAMRGVRLLRMGPDTLLTVLGRDGKWLKVQLISGETGWAYSDFIACCKNADY